MKTKTAVLNGKPDAGNPHVRFDEGEVASTKPRRGSLLYKLYVKERTLRERVIRIFGMKVFSYPVRHARRIVAPEGNEVSNVPPHCEVSICGTGNRVMFREPVDEMFCGEIYIGSPDSPANGCVVEIGAGTTSNGCEIRLMEDGSRCVIGSDCMFSDGVRIWCSDTHAILCGGRLNFGEVVTIGDHVWIGAGASILKNTSVPGGCVVGTQAVVSGIRDVPAGSVLAGNPARVVRTGVTWFRERPNQASEEELSSQKRKGGV